MTNLSKTLSFAVKPNMHKAPRINVQSADKKTTFGSFQADDCSQFDNWSSLTLDETIELKQYMDNLEAVKHFFSDNALSEQTEFKIRLPKRFIKTLNELNALAYQENIQLNFYDAMISAAIQSAKIMASQLSSEKKQEALTLLDKIGLSERKKTDINTIIQSIFSELLSIHNKSEKMHQKALFLFQKDKSMSPMTIDEIAKGKLSTSRWLATCAIDILIEEKPDIIQKLLTEDNLLFLWVTPLLKEKHEIHDLVNKAMSLKDYPSLTQKITDKAGKMNEQE